MYIFTIYIIEFELISEHKIISKSLFDHSLFVRNPKFIILLHELYGHNPCPLKSYKPSCWYIMVDEEDINFFET